MSRSNSRLRSAGYLSAAHLCLAGRPVPPGETFPGLSPSLIRILLAPLPALTHAPSLALLVLVRGFAVVHAQAPVPRPRQGEDGVEVVVGVVLAAALHAALGVPAAACNNEIVGVNINTSDLMATRANPGGV